jgi:hypothetical protein
LLPNSRFPAPRQRSIAQLNSRSKCDAGDEGHHHEELTQEQLGTVHFPVSCTPDAQKSFEKGVALLHSFWYEESEKTFLDSRKAGPEVRQSPAWEEALVGIRRTPCPSA